MTACRESLCCKPWATSIDQVDKQKPAAVVTPRAEYDTIPLIRAARASAYCGWLAPFRDF